MDIQTAYGTMQNCLRPEYDTSGRLLSAMTLTASVLQIHGQRCIPQYHFDDFRRKYIPSVTFYPNGVLRSISLDQQQIFPSPLGKFPAELLTFYPSGALRRLFPLNGKLSAYWSETDELKRSHALPLTINGKKMDVKITCLHFYATGALRSLTLAPSETLVLQTPVGPIKTRIGFSLYPDGALESLEPAAQTAIAAELGPIPIYDPSAVGIHADCNSLRFTPDGQLQSFRTTAALSLQTPQGLLTAAPATAANPLTDNGKITLPSEILFTPASLIIKQRQQELHLSPNTKIKAKTASA